MPVRKKASKTSMRREVLAAHLFANLREVRETLHRWMVSYNEERPHASLGNLPPRIFKQQLTGYLTMSPPSKPPR